MISISVIQNKAFDRLMDLVENPNFFAGWADTRALAMYSEAQMERWASEGASEGSPWDPIESTYFLRKRRMFRSYFGEGTKTLIATSRLLASVLPPSFRSGPEASHGEEFRKVVTDKSLVIATSTPYGTFVDDLRSFSTWSPEFRKNIAKDYADYLRQSFKRARA